MVNKLREKVNQVGKGQLVVIIWTLIWINLERNIYGCILFIQHFKREINLAITVLSLPIDPCKKQRANRQN